MIYSKDDVIAILNEIRETIDGHKKCRPWDCGAIEQKLKEIEQKLVKVTL